MIKFTKEDHTYTRYILELTPKLVKHLQKQTKKKVSITTDPNGIHSEKLCAFALEGITQKDIEENILYSLIERIKDSDLNEIKLYSIEYLGNIIDTERYVPYSLYVLRSNM